MGIGADGGAAGCGLAAAFAGSLDGITGASTISFAGGTTGAGAATGGGAGGRDAVSMGEVAGLLATGAGA